MLNKWRETILYRHSHIRDYNESVLFSAHRYYIDVNWHGVLMSLEVIFSQIESAILVHVIALYVRS